jgi:hypothetical protein
MYKHLVAAFILLNVFSLSSPTAVEQFAKLRDQANAARRAGDKRGRLEAVLEIQKLFNDAPDTVEAAARAYVEVGDTQNALTALSQFVEEGQVDDKLLSGKDPVFATLADLPQYKSILEHMARNKGAVSQSETAFTLSDPGILAEDVAYDAHSKTFLITSVLEKKILRVTFDGQATDFAQSPSHWPMLAVKVDSGRNLVWATEVALDGFTIAPKADWGRSAVVCFDLHTGGLIQRIEGPAHTALGDMALTQQGDPIVSDGDGGGIYRVAGNRLELVNGKDFISPQTPDTLADDQHVFIPDYARGIGILDLKSEQVRWLNKDTGMKVALNGIDGLYFYRGSLLLTQNGTSPERVIRLLLDKGLTRVVSQQIIEQGTPTLGDPTHGIIVGNSFYYIANAGWSELDEHGDLKAGSKLTPASLKRFPLG